MFSLNALDPKLVWHIEKETKEGLGSWEKRGGGPNGQRETEGERRGTQRLRHRGRCGDTEKGRQGKPNTPPKKKTKTKNTKPREKQQDFKANEFRSPRKGVGEETKTLPSLHCPSWGGGVKAPGLAGVGGHLGAQGSLVLDCGMSRPTDQGALPHSSEAWEPTLGILAGVGAPGPTAPCLSP